LIDAARSNGGYSISVVSSTAPVRVRLRYASFDAFIERFAPNVTRGGVFLASRNPPPVGTTFAFEIQLAGGEVALAGDGKVTWIKPYDPAAPQKPHGMGVQFLRLDPPSRELLGKILARKAAAASSGAVRAPLPGVPSSAHKSGTNGTSAAIARVDTSVDLAAEFGVDEARLRRTIDRHWLGAGKAAGEMDELENLLKPDMIEPVSVAQALAGLGRLLDPSASRRSTGGFRPLGDVAPHNGDKSDEPR
jgi:uncharacterized protein (TIGR02266 family)